MKQSHVHLVVVTPYAQFFEGEVDFVVLPTSDGEYGILANHDPIVTAIHPGSLRFQQEGNWRYAFVSNGYAQVGKDYTVVITNAAEWANEIDVEHAQHTLEKNLQRIEKVNKGEEQVDALYLQRYEHAVRRARARLKVAEGEKRRQQSASSWSSRESTGF